MTKSSVNLTGKRDEGAVIGAAEGMHECGEVQARHHVRDECAADDERKQAPPQRELARRWRCVFRRWVGLGLHGRAHRSSIAASARAVLIRGFPGAWHVPRQANRQNEINDGRASVTSTA
jgi:hypothetical protein